MDYHRTGRGKTTLVKTRLELYEKIWDLKLRLYEAHSGYNKCHDAHGLHPRACEICILVAERLGLVPRADEK